MCKGQFVVSFSKKKEKEMEHNINSEKNLVKGVGFFSLKTIC